MRVKIGPYVNWTGPYQIAEMLMFWEDKYDDEFCRNQKIHNFGTWLSGGEDRDSWLMKLCNWWHSKQKRKVDIRIDNYDVWNAHNTASMILLPLLKRLKQVKHGSGYIDDEDVPEAIRSTAKNAWTGIADNDRYNYGYSDNHIHTRYAWVLNEIIWALEQDQPDCDWEEKFWKKHPKLDLEKYPEDEGATTIPVRWKETGECDWEGRKLYQERIDNGFRLMGKYYQTLWD